MSQWEKQWANNVSVFLKRVSSSLLTWVFVPLVLIVALICFPLLPGSNSLLNLLLSFLLWLGLPPLVSSLFLLRSKDGFFFSCLTDGKSTVTWAKSSWQIHLYRATCGARTFARCSLILFIRVSVFCTARSQSSREPVSGDTTRRDSVNLGNNFNLM